MPKPPFLKWENLAEYFFLFAIFFLPFSIALLEIGLYGSFFFWLTGKILKKESLSSDRFLFIFAGGFIIASSISAFEGGYPALSVRGIVKIIKYTLVMLLAVDLFRHPIRLKHLCVVFLASYVLVLLDALYQRFSGGADLIRGLNLYYADGQLRLTGPFKFYGLLGAYLIGILPVILSVVMKQANGWKKIAWAFLFLISLYVLYKTHSRGAWIASFFAFVLYAWMIRNKWMLGIIAVGMIAAPFLLPHNALIHLDAERKEQSLVERYHLWHRAIQVIQNRPWFGCGINTYVRNYSKFDELKNWRVPEYYVHNGYLQLAAETGLVSAAFFLLLLGKGMRSGYIAYRNSKGRKKFLIAGLISGFAALLIQAAVDTTLHNLQSAVLIWLLLGLLIAARYIKEVESYSA